MTAKKPREIIDANIWTGIACLKAHPQAKNFRRFGKGKGAYVNVVAWAEGAKEFEDKVKRHTESLDCILVGLENVQLLESRMQEDDFPEDLITMRETARRQREDTMFGTFHIWHQDDAN